MEIKLCAFADEYSSSLDEQIKGLRENNIYYIELRGVDGKNITAWDVEDAVNWKKKLSGELFGKCRYCYILSNIQCFGY